MSPMYEVTGYDRKTGHLVAFYDVTARRISSVKHAAGAPSFDDGLGAYALNRDQVSVISRLLETPIDNENLDYFLEAYDEGADRKPPGA